jgi:hypothetical protein
MQRIFLALVLVLIFSASVFAQEVPLDFAPLIQFNDKFFDDLRQMMLTLSNLWSGYGRCAAVRLFSRNTIR